MRKLILTLLIIAVGIYIGYQELESQAPDIEYQQVESTAEQALSEIRVSAYDHRKDYDRKAQFGNPWLDIDRNGCDTRNDILNRDLDRKKFKPGSDCVITSGTMTDPYTGQTIIFNRGEGPNQDGWIQIDHVISLHNAWVTGAQDWSQSQREEFANDPLNLLAVSSDANREKSNLSFHEWQPENDAYLCDFTGRYIAVKHKYDLSVTVSEKDALENALNSCPNLSLPTN